MTEAPKLEQALKEQRVVIRGWSMFDKYHADESENTAPARASDWRATAWKVHPITGIEILTTGPLSLPPNHRAVHSIGEPLSRRKARR